MMLTTKGPALRTKISESFLDDRFRQFKAGLNYLRYPPVHAYGVDRPPR
jgi:hypothetical protein